PGIAFNVGLASAQVKRGDCCPTEKNHTPVFGLVALFSSPVIQTTPHPGARVGSRVRTAGGATRNCKPTCQAAHSSAVLSPLAGRALCRDLINSELAKSAEAHCFLRFQPFHRPAKFSMPRPGKVCVTPAILARLIKES